MPHTHYVTFEPGIGSETVLHPKHASASIVGCVPNVQDVQTAQSDGWFEKAQIRTLDDLKSRQPGDPSTRVAIFRDDRHLFIAFDCLEPEMSRTRRFVPADAADGSKLVLEGAMPRVLDFDDNVHVMLDPSHDHSSYYRLRVNMNGARRASRKSSSINWTIVPSESALPIEGLIWESAVAARNDGWRAAFKVDLASLKIEPKSQPLIGLGLFRTRIVESMRVYSWTPTHSLEHAPALSLGDLYLNPGGIVVESIDLNGGLQFAQNTIKLVLAAAAPCDVQLIASYATPSKEILSRGESPVVALRPNIPTTVPVSFEIDDRYRKGVVTIAVIDRASEKPLFQADYPAVGNAGLRIGLPHHGTQRELPDPDRSDPKFHWKKRDRVVAKIPKFTRRTTAQGAPSDFMLTAQDGSVEFNLMQPGALKRIADWIGGIFADDDERLIAVAQLTNDSWVTTHASPRVPMQYGLTALSMLRLGGGHCYSRAVVGAGIVNELPDPRTGRNHVAWACLVLGHVVTAIKRGDDYVLIDPTGGHFFYNADNTAFATASELGKNHELIKRVSDGFNRIKNYGYPEGHVRLDEGIIVWPAGAPPK